MSDFQTASIRIPITVDDATAAAFASAKQKVESFAAAGERAMGGVATGAHNAKGAFALFGDEIGTKMNKHLRSIAGSGELIGGIMSKAFMPLAIVGFIGYAKELGDQISKLVSDNYIWTDSMQAAYKAQVALNGEIVKQVDELTKLRGENLLIGLSGSKRTEAEFMAVTEEVGKLEAKLRQAQDTQYLYRNGLHDITAAQNEAAKAEEAKVDAQIKTLQQKQANISKQYDAEKISEAAAAQSKLNAELEKQNAIIERAVTLAAASTPWEKVGQQYDKMLTEMKKSPGTMAVTVESGRRLYDVLSDLKDLHVADSIREFNSELSKLALEGFNKRMGAFGAMLTPTVESPNKRLDAIAEAMNLQLAGTQDRMLDLRAIMDDFANSGSNMFAAWTQGTRTAAQAFTGMAQSIAMDTLMMAEKFLILKAVSGIFGAIFNTSVTGMGLGSHAMPGGAGFSWMNIAPLAPHAAGGSFGPNDWMLVGERGPEIIPPLGRSGMVIPNGGFGGVQVIFEPGAIDARGADASILPRLYRVMEQIGTATAERAVKRQRESTLRS